MDTIEYSLYEDYKRLVEDRGDVFDIDPDTFKALTSSSCYYCGIGPSQQYAGPDGHIYLYSELTTVGDSHVYDSENVVPCCAVCKQAKGDMSGEQFLAWIRRAYTNLNRRLFTTTPGQLIDLLFTTDYKCWWAQERLMDRSLSEGERAEEARKAQEYNAKRTNLIRTIDAVLGFSEHTNTEKTYSNGDDALNRYTYFK